MCEIICSLTLVAGSNPTAGHGDRPLSSQAAVGAGTKKIPTCSMALSAEYRTKFFSTGKHWRLHMSKKILKRNMKRYTINLFRKMIGPFVIRMPLISRHNFRKTGKFFCGLLNLDIDNIHLRIIN